MKKFEAKEKKKSLHYLKSEYKKKILSFMENESTKLENKYYNKKKTNFSSRFCRKESIACLKNRCVISGRARSIIRLFRLSRLSTRKLGRRGELYGLRKVN